MKRIALKRSRILRRIKTRTGVAHDDLLKGRDDGRDYGCLAWLGCRTEACAAAFASQFLRWIKTRRMIVEESEARYASPSPLGGERAAVRGGGPIYERQTVTDCGIE